MDCRFLPYISFSFIVNVYHIGIYTQVKSQYYIYDISFPTIYCNATTNHALHSTKLGEEQIIQQRIRSCHAQNNQIIQRNKLCTPSTPVTSDRCMHKQIYVHEVANSYKKLTTTIGRYLKPSIIILYSYYTTSQYEDINSLTTNRLAYIYS